VKRRVSLPPAEDTPMPPELAMAHVMRPGTASITRADGTNRPR
jgi:hypothetical protein